MPNKTNIKSNIKSNPTEPYTPPLADIQNLYLNRLLILKQ
jgi:hypothetical protein